VIPIDCFIVVAETVVLTIELHVVQRELRKSSFFVCFVSRQSVKFTTCQFNSLCASWPI
jgi:hypothetical protein